MAAIARLILWFALIGAGLLLSVAGPAAGQGEPDGGLAYSIELPGTIDPATERWIGQAIGEAEEKGAELIIIRIDTPGGLIDSTREIVQEILGAEVPVVVYVSPDGARAASAGLFITQAGDVAAMAPQTNIGSATPITLGPGETDEVLGRKIENDAAAYVRALTAGHGRNADLAEEMVRDAVNVTAEEALDRNLIDIVAPNEQALLVELDGFEIEGPKAGELNTESLRIERRDMPLQFDLLQILVNPNISFLLLLIGIAGLGFELFNPGLIVPGALGGISLLLGLYGTAQLPVALVGILLLVAALAFLVAEAHLPTGGVLGGAGIVALAAGGLLLYDTDSDAIGVSPAVAIGLALALGIVGAVVVRKLAQAADRPYLAGHEELIGMEGVVRRPLDPVGQVFVDGARWRAVAKGGPESVGDGARVKVDSIDGLTLGVSPVDEDDEDELQRDGNQPGGN
ncbi:MAG: NfeD family protein [Solirubrobacterales bacterium]